MTAPLFAADTLTLDYVLVIEKCLASTGKPCFTVEAYHKDRSHLLIGLHETLEAACREACRVGLHRSTAMAVAEANQWGRP